MSLWLRAPGSSCPTTLLGGASIVIWLIWAWGFYGVIGSKLWPPVGVRDVLAYVGLVLLPIVAARMMCARVVLDENGIVSHELLSRRFTWGQISGFSARGQLVQNKVGANLTDGRWTLLQYHHYGPDMVRQLDESAAKLRGQHPNQASDLRTIST